MADSDKSAETKVVRLPREKGRIGRGADRFAARWRKGMRWVIWRLFQLTIGFVLVSFLLVILLRFVNPYLTPYYVSERMRLGEISRDWTPIEEFSSVVPRAMVAAEDANFCKHFGFDVEAIKAALADDGRLRGGSTISQQVAKNVFLWQGRTWLRKGLEAWFTVLIELVWPKERILEVYLNIAEFDEGVFGAGTAAGSYFGTTPDRIGPEWAGRLAAVLPNPQDRSASNPSAFVRKRGRAISSGAATIAADGRADCFEAVDQRVFSWQ